MKKIKLLLVSVAFVACSQYAKYDQYYFLTQAFSYNLTPHLENESVLIKNGFLQFSAIDTNHVIYKHIFSKDFTKTTSYIYVEYDGIQIGGEDWGGSTVKQWKSFDGVTQISIYYPKKNILLLGYFSAYGG